MVTELGNNDGETVLVVHGGQELLEAGGRGIVKVERHEVGLAVLVASAGSASSEEVVQPLFGISLVRSDSWCTEKGALLVLQGNEVLNPEVSSITGVHSRLGRELGPRRRYENGGDTGVSETYSFIPRAQSTGVSELRTLSLKESTWFQPHIIGHHLTPNLEVDALVVGCQL